MQTMKAFLAAALITGIVVAPHVYIESLWRSAHPPLAAAPPPCGNASNTGGEIEKSLIAIQFNSHHGAWIRNLATALQQDGHRRL